MRIQLRSGRRYVTTVQGLSNDFDHNKILKDMKRTFNCNGAVVNDEDWGPIISLTGDQRVNVRAFLLDLEICTEDQLKVWGWD